MITNHQDELDFAGNEAFSLVLVLCTHSMAITAMIIAYNKDAIWSVETKWVSKQSVAWIPCFGWAHYLLGDLFIKRRWEDDGPHIKSWLQKFGTRNFKYVLVPLHAECTSTNTIAWLGVSLFSLKVREERICRNRRIATSMLWNTIFHHWTMSFTHAQRDLFCWLNILR